MKWIRHAFALAGLCAAVMMVLTGARASAGEAGADSGAKAPQVHFVPNSWSFWNQRDHWTTQYGPAFATVIVKTSNNVPCTGGPFALCAYSGAAPMGCKADKAGKFADCKCFEIPNGSYFVNINAILNRKVYRETIKVCGKDGSRCSGHPNMAPACKYVNNHTLIPGADLLSTFSFECSAKLPFGHTQCAPAPYAGCMTAPCRRTSTPGIVDCSCPIFKGAYDIGVNNGKCALGGGLIWSAAFYPKWPGSFAPKSAAPATAPAGNENVCKMP
jgi:hypothetical protein